jgi:hypothetical protein
MLSPGLDRLGEAQPVEARVGEHRPGGRVDEQPGGQRQHRGSPCATIPPNSGFAAAACSSVCA